MAEYDKTPIVYYERVRRLVLKHGMQMTHDFVPGLNKRIEAAIRQAAARARLEHRRQIRPTDMDR